MKTYIHLGYYNEAGDIRAFADYISEKNFDEALAYFLEGNGAFFECDDELVSESDEMKEPHITVKKGKTTYVITYSFNPETVEADLEDCEDDEDTDEYVDIYEIEK